MKKEKVPQHQPKDFSEKGKIKGLIHNPLSHKDNNFERFTPLFVIIFIVVFILFMIAKKDLIPTIDKNQFSLIVKGGQQC